MAKEVRQVPLFLEKWEAESLLSLVEETMDDYVFSDIDEVFNLADKLRSFIEQLTPKEQEDDIPF